LEWPKARQPRQRDSYIGSRPRNKPSLSSRLFFFSAMMKDETGLGLSISHDIIVKQHAGSIEVDTQPGEFTEIIVTLPRAAVFV